MGKTQWGFSVIGGFPSKGFTPPLFLFSSSLRDVLIQLPVVYMQSSHFVLYWNFFRSVGYSTAAFAIAVLEGSTQPGVWFPEEVYTVSEIFTLKVCRWL